MSLVRTDYSKRRQNDGAKHQKSPLKGRLAQVYKGSVTNRRKPVTLKEVSFLKRTV